MKTRTDPVYGTYRFRQAVKTYNDGKNHIGFASYVLRRAQFQFITAEEYKGIKMTGKGFPLGCRLGSKLFLTPKTKEKIIKG